MLVTGGAGFVGSNLVQRLLCDGRRVTVLDDLSRRGAERNLVWLQQQHRDRLMVVVADVRDREALHLAMRGADTVFHLAAQVAVTTSLSDPRRDFGSNAYGTLGVLEAARFQPVQPAVVMTSTNKVYGGLEDVALRSTGRRYEPVHDGVRAHGVNETRPLDFHSPYGCSKGAADQYVCDYARSFGLRTLVLRMSCIYGQRQFGNEDQGWVAHFARRALGGSPLTLYGDGQQVRDLLYVDDLVEALLCAETCAARMPGSAFNMGGGPANATSLLELLERLATQTGQPPRVAFGDWRVGDQRYYVSDTRRFQAATGWRPKVDIDEGLRRLCAWLREDLGQGPAGPAETVRQEAPACSPV